MDFLRVALEKGGVIGEFDARIKPSTRSHAGIETVELEGGFKAFVKRSDIEPPGPNGVRREVAAYRLIEALGWAELMPITVLRELPGPTGSAVEVAMMELFVHRVECPELTSFSEEVVGRAGVFDALIGNSDRANNNWLGVPTDRGALALKLIDHELAFGGGGAVSSSFWNAINREVPSALRSTISDLASEGLSMLGFQDLLPAGEFDGLQQRLSDLRASY